MLQESGKISYGDAREEGNKTSWISPNYPNIGRQFDINANWIISVDESNTLGYNPDGSFPITKIYGWDTWNRPTIDWCYTHQFAEDGGIRVSWRAHSGDLWRTGWHVLVTTGGFPSIGSDYGGGFEQFGPEHNPNASDKSLQYSSDRTIQAAQDGVNWWSLSVFGDYTQQTKEPDSNFTITPDNTVEPAATFSAVLPNVSADNSTNYYVTILAVDARQNDSLGFERSANTFSLSRTGSDYQPGPSKDATYGDGWQYFDSDSPGDGSIILYDGLGSTSISGKTDSSISVDTNNVYLFYLGGLNLYRWVYVTDKVNDIGHPYFPNGSVPSGHPYESPTSDIGLEAGLDHWVRYEGDPLVVAGLSANQEYNIFVLPYIEADFERYTLNGGFEVSAPESTQAYFSLNATTNSTPPPTLESPSNVTLSEGQLSGYVLEFDWNAGQVADGFQVQTQINSGGWTSITPTNQTNFDNGTNPKSCKVHFNPIPSRGDTLEARVSAIDGGQQSPYIQSNTLTS